MELLRKLKPFIINLPRISPMVREENRPFSERLFLLSEKVTDTDLTGMDSGLRE